MCFHSFYCLHFIYLLPYSTICAFVRLANKSEGLGPFSVGNRISYQFVIVQHKIVRYFSYSLLKKIHVTESQFQFMCLSVQFPRQNIQSYQV